MERKNKAYRLSLHQQIYNRLTSMQAFGESKQQGKADGTMQNKIYSYSTYQSYSRACQSFGKYINKNHTEATTLKSAQKYVNEYLQSLVDSGKSAWTVSLYCSALVKLYQIAPDDPHRFQVPSRHRYDITRSRGTTVSDAHFSAKNHAELIAFCKGVGCRKNVLKKLESTDLWDRDRMEKAVEKLSIKDIRSVEEAKHLHCLKNALNTFSEYHYFIHHRQDKGGKYRFAPIIGKNTDMIVGRMKNTPSGQKVFLHIPNRADIHSYRAEYARNLYRELLSRSTPTDQLPREQRYYCRKDAKGKVLSKPVMAQVSKALGHNRISVIASSYLYDL